MKKLKFFGKLVYVINTIVALLLVVSFVLPYLPPKTFPTLALLSLAVSPFILINSLFAIYWLFRLKKQFLMSFLVLLIAYIHFNPFFIISTEADPEEGQNVVSIMSYNVRLFNAYEKNPEAEKVAENISEAFNLAQPDIVCIQEYYANHRVDFSAYPYQFIHFKSESHKLGHAIFSKYPIVNKGSFDFKNSYNNTIYIDALVGNDTLRVYNLHLQSLGILPNVAFLQESGTERIKKKISATFVEQQQQVIQILAHKNKAPYPVILSGDFNNTSFSYIYRRLKKGMNDTFLERGNGLGTTYSFESYPMRIDYILASKSLEVLKFRTIKESLSDHYPVTAKVAW